MNRVAVIGVGRWGRQLLRVLSGRCHVPVCCHQGDPAARAWLAEQYPRVRLTADYAEVLRDATLDAVVIATPIATHATLARQALEAGKHVFVEKPLATSSAEARRLEATAKARGRALFVGHIFLHHPILERLRRRLADDPARYASMTWLKLGTFEEELFWNLLTHEVAIAAALFGAEVSGAEVLHERGLVTGCDLATVRLQFPGDRECLIHVDRCHPAAAKHLTVVTEGGQVLYWDGPALSRFGAGQVVERIEWADEEPLARELDAFLRRLATGTDGEPGLVCGSLVVDLVERLLTARARSCVAMHGPPR